jgi:hypothetical protein
MRIQTLNLTFIATAIFTIFMVMLFFSLIPAVIKVDTKNYSVFLGFIILTGIFVIFSLVNFICVYFCIMGCKIEDETNEIKKNILTRIGMTEEELMKEVFKRYLLEEEMKKFQ